MISVTVFLGALLLFIGLFNQIIQTAVIYQRHRYLATKCSDVLDSMLLNPGNPLDWGRTDAVPTSFGLQDPEFTQYRLSPYSLMRLQSLTGTPIVYPKTGLTYSNISDGFGNFLFVPYNKAINYSTAAGLLGLNGTYGFQLTISPILTVAVKETRATNPLTLTVNVAGSGFPLSNATVSYCFLKVVEKGPGAYPFYTSSFGSAFTDDDGLATLGFSGIASTDSYALIVYVHLSGLVGTGYHERVTSDKKYVLPLIDSFADRRVILAHSYDVHLFGPPNSAVFFNATFVLLTEDFTLREMPMENSTGKIGRINYGWGQPYQIVTIPTFNPGILIITYESNNEYGVVLMPWGMSSMAFTVSFGNAPLNKEWVATDARQVLVNGIAYNAKLALWSLSGYSVIG
jgi:hypothetical protein